MHPYENKSHIRALARLGSPGPHPGARPFLHLGERLEVRRGLGHNSQAGWPNIHTKW